VFLRLCRDSCVSVVSMTGATIVIDGMSAADTILCVKQRVFAANRKLSVQRQRLMYRPGPHSMDPLDDHETLGGAGVARDGTAELDMLLKPLTDVEVAARGPEVCWLSSRLSVSGDNFLFVRFLAIVSFARACRPSGMNSVIYAFFHLSLFSQ
jgi:hypothetical protein